MNYRTSSTQQTMSGYVDAIANLPSEAFLGNLVYFTISQADVDLEKARAELIRLGLSTATLRKNLRPVDAFNKATREFGHKFHTVNGIRTEILVRPVGTDEEQVHRQLIRERTVIEQGKMRRLSYEKVGDLTFTRGDKTKGVYSGFGVQAQQTTGALETDLTTEEENWLDARFSELNYRFDHLLHFMDSHGVRTFVREFIYNLSGICVRESGGLYFVRQAHSVETAKIQGWVRSINSEFHSLPLLNLTEQRDMILQAFEDETIAEVERLMGEIGKILAAQDRTIEPKTFDAYGVRASELAAKVGEYNGMLGARADRASIEIDLFTKQILNLASRVRETTPPPRAQGVPK